MRNDRPKHAVARIGGRSDQPSPPKGLGPFLRRTTWFHVWCLPLIWLAAVSILYWLLWNKGEAGMLILYAGIAGTWALEMFPFIPFAQLFGGVLVMGLLGLFQDLLRVRWWVCLAYFAGTVVTQAYYSLHHMEPTRAEITSVVFFLDILCNNLYFIAPASCVIAALVHIVRAVRAKYRALVNGIREP